MARAVYSRQFLAQGAVGTAVGVTVPPGELWILSSATIYWDASLPNYGLIYVVTVGGEVTGIYSFGTDGLNPNTGTWEGRVVLNPGDSLVAALQIGTDTFGVICSGYALTLP